MKTRLLTVAAARVSVAERVAAIWLRRARNPPHRLVANVREIISRKN
jgi:hypothetical protein